MKRVLGLALALMLVLSMAGCASPDNAATTLPQDPGTAGSTGTTAAPADPNPSEAPTDAPTDPAPSVTPTDAPTEPDPSEAPTDAPTESNPSVAPTDAPTEPDPTVAPTEPPHTHSYGDWVIVKAPTCTQSGSRSRSCDCGDTVTEELPKTDHSYVNGICTGCGKQNFAGTLRVLDNLKADSIYWCSKDVIVYQKGDCYYVADHNGNVLTPGYDYGINCANSVGYVVAYKSEKESLGMESDDDIEMEVFRTTIDSYVLDKKGNVVYTARYIQEGHPYVTTYSGEYIASCNEGRIITYTSDNAGWGEQYVTKTVYIYDMQGTRLATFEKVNSFGTMIGGELLMTAFENENFRSGLIVADRNGKILRSSSDVEAYSYLCNGWTMSGFIGGYALLVEDGVYDLVSKDLSRVYRITENYVDTITNYGSIIVSRIDEGGSLSENFYLVDVTKCAIDAYGYITSTLDAAITKQGYSFAEFTNLFGNDAPYALVSRNDQWGFLSPDGKTEKLYDDAGYFIDGVGIVKDGENIYVIDRNFNQISNAITGYDAVQAKAGGVFLLKKNGTYSVAVYS